MAYILNLKRDPAVMNDLICTTLGTATLQSKDNESVQVPLAPLLSTSKLIRLIVAESHLHPAIHGPLILTCEVSTEALVSVGEILGTGNARTSNENIEEIKQGLCILGVDADLSQDRKNKECYDHLSARVEGVKLEMQDDDENCASGIDTELENSVKIEIIDRVNDSENEDQQRFDIGKEKDMNCDRRNSVHEHNVGNGGAITVKLEIDEDDCEICDHELNYAVKNSKVDVQKLRTFHEKTNYEDKTSEKDKLLVCEVCHYSALTPSILKIHMRIHTGERPYTCRICCSAFRLKHHLKDHMRMHTGEKPYTCAVCSSAFRRKYHLNVHMRRHTGEKPYTCTLCASAFSHHTSLALHMRKHTGEDPSGSDYVSTTSKEFH